MNKKLLSAVLLSALMVGITSTAAMTVSGVSANGETDLNVQPNATVVEELVLPSSDPSSDLSADPSSNPSADPSADPSAAMETISPSQTASAELTSAPSSEPSSELTSAPSLEPDASSTPTLPPSTTKRVLEYVKAKCVGKRAVILTWLKVPNATKYVVYGNRCSDAAVKIKKTTNTTFTVTKIDGEKLTPHKTYKFYVIAHTPDGEVESKKIHFIVGKTKGARANVKSINVDPKAVTLTVGESVNLDVTKEVYKNKKHIAASHGTLTRYKSDDPGVAKVSSSGVITAKGAGTAIIYIQDIGGRYCKCVVTVNASDVIPTTEPTVAPTAAPTSEATTESTAGPTSEATTESTAGPTSDATPGPSSDPNVSTQPNVSASPTAESTITPIVTPEASA